jgi:hypothetical protein
MIFAAGFSNPNPNAGGLDVTMLIHRIANGLNGNTLAPLIDKAQPEDEEHNFSDIGRVQMEDEALDVVKDTTALADGRPDRVKVVVGEDEVGRVLCYVGATHTHCDAHRSELE